MTDWRQQELSKLANVNVNLNIIDILSTITI